MIKKTPGKRNEILKLPYLVLAVSLLITLSATYFSYQNSQIKDRTRFATEVNKSKNVLENNINDYKTLLNSTRAYLEADSNVNQEHISIFLKNLEMQNSAVGVQGVGYMELTNSAKPSVPLKKADSIENSESEILPPNDKSFYKIIYFESFLEDNRASVGFDIEKSTVISSMNSARDTGQITASDKIVFKEPEDSDAPPVYFLYLPIYNGGGIPQSVEEKRNSLKGFVYSAFRADEFIKDVGNTIASNNLTISVYDGATTKENNLSSTQHQNESSFAAVNEANFAGRKWLVEYNSLPDFELQAATSFTPLILLSGTIFSFLLFGMTYLESYARAQSDKIAADLKESEMEKAALLESEQKARSLAENASRAKDEFIANVSHELRTPLNSIAGWSRILQSENLPEAMKQQALQKIDKNLRAQTKIIEDLLDFSEITLGNRLVATQPIRFSDVFEEVIQEIIPAAQEKRIVIEKHNFLNGQKVLGDYPHLKKVIKNLLSNAVKFTHEGGKIIAEAKVDQKMLELTVADSGQGIAPSFLPHIFEQFKQADSSITRSHGGLGMGLAVSRQIIESYGGEIKAKSEGEGKGTQFSVKLPYILN